MLQGVANPLTRAEISTCVDPIPDDEPGNPEKTRLRYSRALTASGLLHRQAL
jgi:hypothetical protein